MNNQLSNFGFIWVTVFVGIVGILCVMRGIRLVRKKRYYYMATSRRNTEVGKPTLIEGKGVVYEGIGYIIQGCVILLGFGLLLYALIASR